MVGETSETESFHKVLDNLYHATSKQVLSDYGESYEMDRLLNGLQSPAHQALFVIQHAMRLTQNVELALNHCQHCLKPSHIFLTSDVETSEPRQKCIPCESYTVLPEDVPVPAGWKALLGTNFRNTKEFSSKRLVAKIVDISQGTTERCTEEQSSLIEQLRCHLSYTLGTDLRNGAAAEVAFDLSLLGICPYLDVYNMLAHIAAAELDRKSGRNLRPASTLRTIERLLAAGIRMIDNPYMHRACQAAYRCLSKKTAKTNLLSADTLESLRRCDLYLCSPRSLLWLWRKSHLFHKVTQSDLDTSISLEVLETLPPLVDGFQDPTLPLVVDFGCGLGVQLLSLASGLFPKSDTIRHGSDTDWAGFNYLGGELSSQSVSWANGIAERWGVVGRCKFIHVSTSSLLDYLLWQVDTTTLRVAWILLNFPTPFRLQAEADSETADAIDGNNHLAATPLDNSFMANPKILKKMCNLLLACKASDAWSSEKLSKKVSSSKCRLLLQSNCEDVAVFIYNALCLEPGIRPIPCKTPCALESLSVTTITTTRTRLWLSQFSEGSVQRACGEAWSSEPLLPVATETEAACHFHKTPIHRCLFQC